MSEDLKTLIHTVGGLSFVSLSIWLLIGAIKTERARRTKERDRGQQRDEETSGNFLPARESLWYHVRTRHATQ